MMARGEAKQSYQPSAEFQAHWPETSGNAVNGLAEADWHPPKPVFWRTDDSIAHGAVLRYFYGRYRGNTRIAETRKLYDQVRDISLVDRAGNVVTDSPENWARLVKQAALEHGADIVGICAYDPRWTFRDRPQPAGQWAIVLGFAHDYAPMQVAPHEDTYIEIMQQYARAGASAKKLANWIQARGHLAQAKTGPMTEDVLMIPAAIEAGLGELGKHGSIINRRLGSNFRLSMVLSDLPLVADERDEFGVDQFCLNCQVCVRACPPDAIAAEKQTVNGEVKWYVDFDLCLPYFVENETCGICLAVCPWSRPGIAPNLLSKMSRRQNRADREEKRYEQK